MFSRAAINIGTAMAGQIFRRVRSNILVQLDRTELTSQKMVGNQKSMGFHHRKFDEVNIDS